MLNERRFNNGSQVVQVPLISLFAASNEVPSSDNLDAIFDRFLLRVHSDNLDSYHFHELMQKGIALERASRGRAAYYGVAPRKPAPPQQLRGARALAALAACAAPVFFGFVLPAALLAALADEKVRAQTIAPKFTGRFNKGVDYVGDLAQFEREFSDDLAVIAHAVARYGLPANLKLSVHSGSDKFSLYPIIRRALARTGAGVHLKTAGTTWLLVE